MNSLFGGQILRLTPMLSPHLSPQGAYEVDTDEIFVDEDETTVPLGYRWVHFHYCSRCGLPRNSSWTSESIPPDSNPKRYQDSDMVCFAHGDSISLSDGTIVHRPESLIEHPLWAVRHEGLNLQIIKAIADGYGAAFESGLVTEYGKDRQDENFRRLWFLFEFLLGDKSIYLPLPMVSFFSNQKSV